MATLIRFKKVEIDSNISFKGSKRRTLKYPVRSVALVPVTTLPIDPRGLESLPEIFWQ
ncbi:MAG: hypothetical protein ACOYNC_06295 [Bacteroidales bacterium]